MVSPRKLLKRPFTSSSALPVVPIWMEPQRSRTVPQTHILFRGLRIQRPPWSFSKFMLTIQQQSSVTNVSGLKFSILNNSTSQSLPRPHHLETEPTKIKVRSVERPTGWGRPSLLYHSNTARICDQKNKTNLVAEDMLRTCIFSFSFHHSFFCISPI